MGKCDVGERRETVRVKICRSWGRRMVRGRERNCERTAEGRDEANFHIIRRVKY
jgi:hypothetical protein